MWEGRSPGLPVGGLAFCTRILSPDAGSAVVLMPGAVGGSSEGGPVGGSSEGGPAIPVSPGSCGLWRIVTVSWSVAPFITAISIQNFKNITFCFKVLVIFIHYFGKH